LNPTGLRPAVDATPLAGRNADMGRSVNEWKQDGAVFTWRYVERAKNYPGWHLAFDSLGLGSFVDLCRRYVEDDTEAPLLRSVRLTPPTSDVLAIPNNGMAAIHAADRLRIIRLPTSDGWIVAESGQDLVLSIGRIEMVAFVAWLSDSTSFDTTFGKAPEFWFWGKVDRASPLNNREDPLQTSGNIVNNRPSGTKRRR